MSRTNLPFALIALALLVSCSKTPPAAPAPTPAPLADGATAVPLYEGLGSYTRAIATASPEAQKYFDQGLNFYYGFNHDEAIRSFRRAGELDPNCAMAYWGIAISNGPHINFPMVPPDRAKAAWEALTKAKELAPKANETDRALIEALAARYADPQPEDRAPLDQAYADAMRKVWSAHPDDPDAGALFAEAMMDLKPWNLWTHDKKPVEGTDEVIATLEAVMAKTPSHPMANHLYIHALEMSPDPSKADAAAERLRTLQPAVGHNVHMPSHIDVLVGRWQKAIDQNALAMEADRKFREVAPQKQGFFRVYVAHTKHMLSYAAMMIGQKERALSTIKAMVDEIPEEWLKEYADGADGFMAMPYEVMLRFGEWDAVLAQPEPADYLPVARTLRHYARGLAFAAKGDAASARAEQKLFLEAKTKIGKQATFGNNPSTTIVEVAEQLLDAEILFREGKHDAAFAAFKKAVASEDALHYDEPPGWIQPIRHAYGAALLQAGRFKDAEAVYRADLKIHPDNGWSLYGLGRCLRARKQTAEAEKVEARFAEVWKNSDIKLSSSCLCLPGV